MKHQLVLDERPNEIDEFERRPSATLQAPPVHLTREGLRRLEHELEWLEKTQLPEVGERIRAIREMSADPLDAGEHAQVMEELAQLRAREAVLRTMIGSGEIIKPHGARGVAHLGSKVTLAENHHRETFTIVGGAEADALKGRLSEDSPLGKSLIGHRAGDVIQWDSPGGSNRARILGIG